MEEMVKNKTVTAFAPTATREYTCVALCKQNACKYKKGGNGT